MGGQFPEALLPDILDYVDIDCLLLSAMPVSRCWREQACAHPIYWRELAYTGRDGHIELHGQEVYAAQVPRHEASRDLFLLRLSRMYGRPIDVSVRWADRDTLGALAAHLPHIRSLSVDALVRHWEATVDALRETPAHLLESLSLLVQYQRLLDTDWEFHPFLPQSLFASQPAALKEVHLSDVGLPCSAEMPVCFSSVETLVVHTTHPSVHAPLPDVFQCCTRLKKLSIYCRAALHDSAFLQADNWSGLDELGLHFLTSWEVLALPLADIPRIVLTPWAASNVIELVPWLGSRLTLEVPPLRPGIERGEFRCFHAEFGVFGDPSSRRRLIQMRFPDERNGSLTNYTLGAFHNPVVNERIVDLTLAGRNWELLVGMGYFTVFPALERLVIVLSQAAATMPTTRAADAQLCSPRLAQLTLGASPGSDPVAVGTADLCDFVRAALVAAPFPIMLKLNNVSLSGSGSKMGELFTQGHDGLFRNWLRYLS